MILVVDIGNSNVVIGGVEGEKILFEARLRTDATKTSDEYTIDLKSILDIYNADREGIEGCIIASVVPQVLNTFQTALMKLTGKKALVVTYDEKFVKEVGFYDKVAKSCAESLEGAGVFFSLFEFVLTLLIPNS